MSEELPNPDEDAYRYGDGVKVAYDYVSKDSEEAEHGSDELLKPLYFPSTIHLFLVDLKKAFDFDSREEAEGARKLVEAAGWQLQTHGYQQLKEEIKED